MPFRLVAVTIPYTRLLKSFATAFSSLSLVSVTATPCTPSVSHLARGVGIEPTLSRPKLDAFTIWLSPYNVLEDNMVGVL